MKVRLLFGRIALFVLCLLALWQGAYAQTLRARVIDEASREPIPYANVIIDSRHKGLGVACDIEGRFTLTLPESEAKHSKVKLIISSVGYTEREYVWRRGQSTALGDITLQENSNELTAVVVTPGKERYRKKGNPAVLLMDRIIAAKEQNRISAYTDYTYREYEKILISQIGTTPGKKFFGLKAEVADRYRDSSALASSHVMPLSLRERQTIHAARHGSTLPPVVTGRRLHGVEAAMDEGNTTNWIDLLLADFDVYQDNYEMLLTEFPSPLNKHWATDFYKYYIQDTVSYQGSACFLLHFRPMNPRSTGLNGNIWVDTLSLAMRHIEMTLPPASNINWVEKMTLGVEFASVQTDRGIASLPINKTIGMVLKPTGMIPTGLEVNVSRHYHNYRFGDEALREEYRDPRSLLPPKERIDAMLVKPGSYGIVEQAVPLSQREQKAVDFVRYLQKHRGFNIISNIGSVFVTGFLSVPLKPLEREKVKLAIGPYETMVGYNALEGVRLRIGGMTTANLMQHLYLEGYTSYGFGDKKWKYYAKATYTPLRRNYHAEEHPRRHIALTAQSDLFIPGDEGASMFKDNLQTILGNIDNRVRFYGERYSISHVRDWTDQLSTSFEATYMRKTPTGDLHYYRLDDQLQPQEIDHIASTSLRLEANYTLSPARYRSKRQGSSEAFSRYFPSIGGSVTLYPKGLWGNRSTFAQLAASYRQRINLSFLGRLDAEVDAGMVVGDAPQTTIFYPTANTGWILRRSAFQTLTPLEFMADRYVRFQGTYHAKGLLLSRIPLIKYLDLREIVSLHGYWGDLSARARTPKAGMEYLPNFTNPMNNHLHLELSAGIENILKIVRVDYFYRLTDRHLPSKQRHAVRLNATITF